MSSTTKVATAIAAGYLLGRTKKLRLAITVGTMLAGGRLAGDVRPGALLQSLSGNREVQRLQDQLRGQLLSAAKSAAVNVTTSRLEAINESLKPHLGGEEQDQQDQQDQQESAEQENTPAKESGRSSGRSGRSGRSTAEQGGQRARKAGGRAAGTAKKAAPRKKAASSAGGR